MFGLSKNMFYFIEAVKVEGYWSIKNREASVQNKNLPFIYHLEEILKENKVNVSKRLLVKVKVPNDLHREEIEVMKDSHKVQFHFEVSPFDNTRKIVFNLPFENQEAQIKLKDINFPLKVLLSKEKVITQCILSSFGYVDLRFWNIEFLRFLEGIANKKKGKLKLTSFIESNISFIISAFSALVDTEGSIDRYNYTRHIVIRMKDKKYLELWKSLLLKCGVKSHVCKDGELYDLIISGWEDFHQLIKLNFKLYHSEKQRKFRDLIELFVREQISRNRAKAFYLEKLKEIERPISAIELAKILKKNRRTIYHYLSLLVKENKAKLIKSKPHQLYLPL